MYNPNFELQKKDSIEEAKSQLQADSYARALQSAKQWPKELFVKDIEAVNRIILASIHTAQCDLMSMAAQHLITAGGKRLRPLLALAIARLGNNKSSENALHLGACIEFIHTATLLHDDVIDDSLTRRGVTSTHEMWGSKAGILAGDFLFAKAFEQMVIIQSIDVLRVLSTASSQIALGEMMEIQHMGNITTRQKEYNQIIYGKTACLFEATCEAAAIISNLSIKQQSALKKYGYHIGMAFQMVDDIKDYTLAVEEMGKTQGLDFIGGKLTLPVIIALEGADSQEVNFWRRTIEQKNVTPEDFLKAMEILSAKDAFNKSFAIAKSHVCSATEALGPFIPCSIIQGLIHLATEIMPQGQGRE